MIRDKVQAYLTTQDQVDLRKTNGALYRLLSKIVLDVLDKPMNVEFLKKKTSQIRMIRIDKVNGKCPEKWINVLCTFLNKTRKFKLLCKVTDNWINVFKKIPISNQTYRLTITAVSTKTCNELFSKLPELRLL
eukprot:UN26100